MRLRSHIVLLAALTVLGLASQALAGRAVNTLDVLADDSGVKALSQPYQAISAAMVIYDKCASFYQFTPEQKKAARDLFDRTSRDYMQAYYDAYVKRVGYRPEQSTIDRYVARINAEQQESLNHMAGLLQTRDCDYSPIRNIKIYVDKILYPKAQPAPEPTLE